MKKLIRNLFCFFLSLLIYDCGSGEYVVSPKGDKVDIILKKGNQLNVELLLISDTSVVYASTSANPHDQTNLFYSLHSDIKSISVKGYDGSGWVTSVMLFQVLPSILFAIAAATYSQSSEGLVAGTIFLFPAIITTVLFASSEGETPEWNDQSPVEDLNKLKIYSRYPVGLNEEQLKLLLSRYSQKQIKKL